MEATKEITEDRSTSSALLDIPGFVTQKNKILERVLTSRGEYSNDYDRHYYTLRLKIVPKDHPAIGKVQEKIEDWENTSGSEGHETYHDMVLLVQEDSSEEEIHDLLFDAIAGIYGQNKRNRPVFANAYAFSYGHSPFLSSYSLLAFMDIMLAAGADTRKIREHLLDYTREIDLEVRLEAMRALEKLGIANDPKAKARFEEIARANDYDLNYLKANKLTAQQVGGLVVTSHEMFDVCRLYATDVLAVLSQKMKEGIPEYQWRWRIVGDTSRRAGQHLLDGDGRLIAFSGDPGNYSANHLQVFNPGLYEEYLQSTMQGMPAVGIAPDIYSTMVTRMADDAAQRKAQLNQEAVQNLTDYMADLRAGRLHGNDFYRFMRLSEETEFGISQTDKLILLYAELLATKDHDFYERVSSLLVRQFKLKESKVVQQLFSVLMDPMQPLATRLEVGWWLRGVPLRPGMLRDTIGPRRDTLAIQDRILVGVTLLANYLAQWVISQGKRAQKIGVADAFYGESNELLSLVLLFLYKEKTDQGDSTGTINGVILSPFGQTHPEEVAKALARHIGGFLYNLAYDKPIFIEFARHAMDRAVLRPGEDPLRQNTQVEIAA